MAYKKYSKKNKYTILTCTISALGSSNENRNPDGWYYFTFGMIVLGAMNLPLSLYVYRRWILVDIFWAQFELILDIIGLAGLILIGVFPDNDGENFYKDVKYGHIHNIVAIVGIGGYVLLGPGRIILLCIDLFVGQQLYSEHFWKFIPGFLVFLTSISLSLYFLIKWQIMCRKDNTLEPWPGEGIYSFSLWEWVLFISNSSALYSMLFALPFEIPII
ncbi:MAG: DUF998 domain-containing protein [archaeon]|nr:DUF998 domain-containing protein [archaeon]